MNQSKLNCHTINLMNQISSSQSDLEVIKMIKNASPQIINHKLKEYDNNLYYLNNYADIYSSILAQVMYTKSEEVIHTVLNLIEKIDDFAAFYKFLIRQKYQPLPLKSMINITMCCQKLGLNLNETIQAKYTHFDSMKNEFYELDHQANYLIKAIEACVKEKKLVKFFDNGTRPIETGEIEYVFNPESVEFFQFLVSKGLKKQEHNGELIDVAITHANKDLVNIVCSLEGIDMEYIDKGINSWNKMNNKPNVGHAYKIRFEYQQSLKIIDYIKPCFESIKMSRMIKNQETIKICQKI